jgi:hypothetical protein
LTIADPVPAAKFSVAVRGYTVDDADMLCLDLFVDFVSGLVLSHAEKGFKLGWVESPDTAHDADADARQMKKPGTLN